MLGLGRATSLTSPAARSLAGLPAWWPSRFILSLRAVSSVMTWGFASRVLHLTFEDASRCVRLARVFRRLLPCGSRLWLRRRSVPCGPGLRLRRRVLPCGRWRRLRSRPRPLRASGARALPTSFLSWGSQSSSLRRPTFQVSTPTTSLQTSWFGVASVEGCRAPRRVPSMPFSTTSTACSTWALRASCSSLPTLGFITFQVRS